MPVLKINCEFELGQKVYLVTDADQYARQVVAISKNITGAVSYTLACGAEEPTEHYEQEICDTKDVIGMGG
jgi:hypothetical protein